jgi:hypothetical protein
MAGWRVDLGHLRRRTTRCRSTTTHRWKRRDHGSGPAPPPSPSPSAPPFRRGVFGCLDSRRRRRLLLYSVLLPKQEGAGVPQIGCDLYPICAQDGSVELEPRRYGISSISSQDFICPSYEAELYLFFSCSSRSSFAFAWNL